MDYITNSPNETRRLASKIASELSGGEVLCLYGSLGAGKTTFVSGLINFFLPQKRVLSPTFIIVRHYSLTHALIKNIYHLDLYRISKEEELEAIGITEFIGKSDAIVAIEWAEKLQEFLPKKRIGFTFITINDDQRMIKLSKYG